MVISTQPGRIVRRGVHRTTRAVFWLLLAGWAAMQVVPFVLMLLSSVKSNTEVFAEPFGLPEEFRWSNFASAWSGASGTRSLGRYFFNSVLVAVYSLTIGVGGGTMLGYVLARRSDRRWSSYTHRYLVILLSIPALVALVPVFLLMGTLGLRNSSIGLALVYSAFIAPTAAVLMRSSFASFPKELIEAAQIDGASEWTTFRKIVFPLSRGPLIGVSSVALIWVWSELLFAIVLLNQPDNKTLTVGLLDFRGQYSTDLGVLFAGLTIATIPIVILFVIFQRQVTEGITLGAVKA